jgi:hypothetical protein
MSEMKSRVDGQLATLESARTRAGIAIAASGVIVGLFAQNLKPPIGNWGIAALVAFVLGTVPAIWILLPHRLRLNSNGNTWVEWASRWDRFVKSNAEKDPRSPQATDERGSARLALVMADSMRDWFIPNRRMLNWIHICVALSFAAVLIQMICWVGAISSNTTDQQQAPSKQTKWHAGPRHDWNERTPGGSCRLFVGPLSRQCDPGFLGPNLHG